MSAGNGNRTADAGDGIDVLSGSLGAMLIKSKSVFQRSFKSTHYVSRTRISGAFSA
jgi:hypothetical protein